MPVLEFINKAIREKKAAIASPETQLAVMDTNSIRRTWLSFLDSPPLVKSQCHIRDTFQELYQGQVLSASAANQGLPFVSPR